MSALNLNPLSEALAGVNSFQLLERGVKALESIARSLEMIYPPLPESVEAPEADSTVDYVDIESELDRMANEQEELNAQFASPALSPEARARRDGTIAQALHSDSF